MNSKFTLLGALPNRCQTLRVSLMHVCISMFVKLTYIFREKVLFINM